MQRVRVQGILIVEAVVAAFLMIFAFAASTALFHSALQWEAQGSNVRRASLVAEKKMGELRAWSEAYHRNHSFNDGWDSIVGVQSEYPEAPGFKIFVKDSQPTYKKIINRPDTPEAGVYSPTSNFYDDAAFKAPAGVDKQFNSQYNTYSYVRSFNFSFRQVEVIVTFSNGKREFRLVSLIGDPLPRVNPNVSITLVGGGNSTLNGGDHADYRATLTGPGGRILDDVVCLWGVDLEKTTGAVKILPKDANGRQARIVHEAGSSAGVVYLKLHYRYRGRQYLYTAPSAFNVT